MRGDDVVPPDGVDLPALPVGWRWVYLREILTRIDSGKNFRCEERPPTHSEYGIVKISAITWGTYDESESKTITDHERVNLAHIIQTGDFLFSRANTIELVGACLIVHETRRRLLLSDKILRFEFAGDFKNWINWMLKSRLGRTQIEALSTGNQESMRNIGQKQIGHICVPVPPANEQRRIGHKIEELFSELDKGVEALTTAREQLKAYRRSVLKYAFEGKLIREWRTRTAGRIEPVEKLLGRTPCPPRPNRWNSRTTDVIVGHPALAVGNPGIRLPEGWKWCQLADIARMESGHTPSRNHPEWWGGDVCWIGIADASEHDGQVIHETLQHTNPDGLANSAARLLPAGTVCISRTASVGYVVVMGKEMATSQDFVNWTPTEAVTSEWLRLIFAADKQALRRFGKGSVHKTVYFPEWLSIHIALPPIDEQKVITAEVERVLSDVEHQGRAVDEALVRTSLLRQAILKQAFSGSLVAQDAKDEPAAALLERIRAKQVSSTTKNERNGKIVKNGKKKVA